MPPAFQPVRAEGLGRNAASLPVFFRRPLGLRALNVRNPVSYASVNQYDAICLNNQ